MNQDYSNLPFNTNAASTSSNVSTTATRASVANGYPMFWKVLLKDLIVTVVGVGILGFFLLLIPLLSIVACVGGCVVLRDSHENMEFAETWIDGSEDALEKVVVLPVDGTIESDTADGSSFLTKALKTIEEDDNVKALVLRVNSPGGTVSGSAYYHRLIKRLKDEKKIPIVVSMGDMTCSGGYYISMAADELVAEPSTWTGSIGVICSLVNAAEFCNKVGLRSNAIASGSMKEMGSMMKEPTDEENAVWQALVDDSYEQFLAVVRDGRPWYRAEDVEDEDERAKLVAERDAELRQIADGRVYSANQALERHLIDRIGYLDDTIDVALERAGLKKDSAQIVVYTEPETFFSALGVDVKAKNQPLEKATEALRAATTPKAYYLCPNALPF